MNGVGAATLGAPAIGATACIGMLYLSYDVLASLGFGLSVVDLGMFVFAAVAIVWLLVADWQNGDELR